MKTVTIDGKTYNAEHKEDGQIVLTPVPELPEPNKIGYWVFFNGAHSHHGRHARANENDYNVFKTYGGAMRCAKAIRNFYALWQIKERVDPDFVPDWENGDEQKFVLFWSTTEKCWYPSDWYNDSLPLPYFSSEEKADEAIAILSNWGVRP